MTELEDKFRRIASALYDTSLSPEVLDAEVTPYLADDVVFTDPWQTGRGKSNYRQGAAGFHAMFKFELDISQVNVQLRDGDSAGRAIVDGIMHLRQFAPLLTYPLRTILVFDFTLDENGTPSIHAHEEMWSIGDMLAAVPALGWAYKTWFRPAFSKGFLLASRVFAGRR